MKTIFKPYCIHKNLEFFEILGFWPPRLPEYSGFGGVGVASGLQAKEFNMPHCIMVCAIDEIFVFTIKKG